MKKPLLQIALDTLTIDEAIDNVEKIKDVIDVIEVGTILISSVGTKAVKEISQKYPHKIIVADGKIADAGTIFGKMFFKSGADFTTTICAAETPTIQAVIAEGKKYGSDKEVQVELTSHFTWAQTQQWRDVGVTQVVYHRSRDAQASGVSWSNDDIGAIKKLAAMGFKVTVTGGITIDDIKFFKGIPIYIFIAGRAIRDAVDPKAAVLKFKAEFGKYW